MVRPLALPLEAGEQRVMAQRFFAKAQLGQARIADHQVAGDHGHEQAPSQEFIGRVRALARAEIEGKILLPLPGCPVVFR